ncbi:MAG: porin [Pseudomonadota bacterium]
MKKVLSLAIAAALVAPVAAMADSTVYGKVRVATDFVDDNTTLDDEVGLSDQSSRLGIKGSEDLGNGLKAIYKMEFGVKVGDELGTLGARNAYVGLAGNFGTFLAGRHDTPMKMSTGKLDLFADTIADYDTGSAGIAGHTGLFKDRREDGVLAYISPNWGGFTLAGAAVQVDSTDDFLNAYSLAGMYSNGPWYVSAAVEEIENSVLTAGATEDEFQTRLGFGLLDMAGFTAAVVYETRDDIDGVTGHDTEAWQLSGGYGFGDHMFKAMYGTINDEFSTTIGTVDTDEDSYAFGYQYNLSKRTDAQVVYTARENDDTNEELDGLSFQLSHNF